jgi:hypothetical protein
MANMEVEMSAVYFLLICLGASWGTLVYLGGDQ